MFLLLKQMLQGFGSAHGGIERSRCYCQSICCYGGRNVDVYANVVMRELSQAGNFF
jgi:hypothetical protein